MAKSADAFRTISEVADWLETPAHVLRFWESKFNQVKPVKRAGGRRYYRPADMKLLGGIKKLLHDDGMTIKGVQKMLREHGVAHVAAFSQPLGDAADDVDIERVEDVARDTVSRRAETSDNTIVDHAQPEDGTSDDPSPEAEEETPPIAFSRRSEPPKDATDTSETPELPSFQRRRTEPPEDRESKASISEPSTEDGKVEKPVPVAAPRPAVIQLPDDPADDVSADQGVLALLSRLPSPLPTDIANRLDLIAAKLRATTGSGAKG